jgi:hypothetical protein
MSGKKKLIVDVPAEIFDMWDEVVKAEGITRTDAITESMVAQCISFNFRQMNKDFATKAKEIFDEQIEKSKRGNRSNGGQTISSPTARQPRSRKNTRVRQSFC